jgi:hypothetical protein
VKIDRFRTGTALLALALLLLPAARADDEPDAEAPAAAGPERVAHLPLNLGGMPGLLVTTATRTVDPLRVAGAISYDYLWESGRPGLLRHVAAASVALGIPTGGEFSVHVPYVRQEIDRSVKVRQPGYTIRAGKVEGLGDIDLALRWGIFPKAKYVPSFSVGAGVTIASGESPQMVGSVDTYGLRLLLAAAVTLSDLEFTDYPLGVFIDGQAVFRDLGLGDQREEKSGRIDLGFLFPVDDRGMANFLVEYNGAYQQGWFNDMDTHGLTGGFRFVLKWFGATVGYGYVFQETKGWSNFQRVAATVGARMP